MLPTSEGPSERAGLTPVVEIGMLKGEMLLCTLTYVLSLPHKRHRCKSSANRGADAGVILHFVAGHQNRQHENCCADEFCYESLKTL